MSEANTALDLALEWWRAGMNEKLTKGDRLRAIPADAPEIIAALKAELASKGARLQEVSSQVAEAAIFLGFSPFLHETADVRDHAKRVKADLAAAQNVKALLADEVRVLKAELALNAAMLARQTDLARQAENERDAARGDAEALIETLARIKKEGPVERYGSNVPHRLCQWILAVREEAGDALAAYRKSR